MHKLIVFVFLTLLIFTEHSYSKENNSEKIFYSLKSKATRANVRTGPGKRYPVKWIYKRPHWPVKVINNFERWKKIEDFFGQAGWIHESLLSPKRTVVIKANNIQEIYAKQDIKSRVVMIVENSVIANLIKCNLQWCYIEIKDNKGWTTKEHLWGVEQEEIIK